MLSYFLYERKGETFMAKNPNFTRSMQDKFVIKGKLSGDGSIIKYIDDDKEEQEYNVADCFKNFLNENIELSIAVKINQDLGVRSEEE